MPDKSAVPPTNADTPPPATSVVITPDMVMRGRDYLWASGRLAFEAPGADDLLVQELLETALGLRPAGED